ncbi:hypothetical protein [Marinifilum sp. D737]|uniref:hypothetical protein n=1 Tax=Marinifilum sp. D737 TaxID=2969628 RepID=UPI002272B4DE|nr:hypothetical protein [Marinifilum sp. D737]MCY1635101.1 hypothetical protein [Marinifilum sp. D737]
MKTNTFFYTLLIALFSISFTACSDDDSYVPEEQQSSVSIRLTFVESLTKTVDEGDEEDQIIEVKGVVVDSVGRSVQADVELYTIDMTFVDSSITDTEGNFSFLIDSQKNYKIHVLKDEQLIGVEEIKNI